MATETARPDLTEISVEKAFRHLYARDATVYGKRVDGTFVAIQNIDSSTHPPSAAPGAYSRSREWFDCHGFYVEAPDA